MSSMPIAWNAAAPIWMVNLGRFDPNWGTGLGILSTLIVRSAEQFMLLRQASKARLAFISCMRSIC